MTTPLPVSVLIPARWTPEQALAVLERLNDLRDALWAVHGNQIQQDLQQQHGAADTSTPGSDPHSDGPVF